ncbi:MAG: hypothetical protein ACJ763_02020 [Bdellovibrionia bacterium]
MKLITIKPCLKRFGFTALAIVSASTSSFANEAKPESAEARRPCAVVDQYAGDSQILNESRTRVSEADVKAPVECGGWVSVQNGWLVLQHRFGYRIHVGPGSFAQLQDDADALVVYRGQVFAQSGGGMGEFRVVTPNARIRLSRASAVALFDPEEEKTQLTVVDGKAQFENRFDTTKKANVTVKSGYASMLDFKLLRIVPSVPKVAATSSLKAKLKELHVPEGVSERALAIARNRQKELFSSFEKTQNENVKPEKAHEKNHERSIASVEAKRGHNDPEKNQQIAKDYLFRKTLGGNAEGMKILGKMPAQRKPAQRARVEVLDPEAQLMVRQKSAEDAEKRRLIEELSKIKSD